MNDPTFRNINRMLVYSFKNDSNDRKRSSYFKCYMLLVKIRDFNVLIDNKSETQLLILIMEF